MPDEQQILAETEGRFVMQSWEARKVFVDGLESRSLDPEVGMRDRAERISLFRHFRDLHHGLKRLGR